MCFVFAAKTRGSLWHNKSVLVYCDNNAPVAMINKGSTRNPVLMKYLRHLFWLLATYNLRIWAFHIKLINLFPDSSSNGQNPTDTFPRTHARLTVPRRTLARRILPHPDSPNRTLTRLDNHSTDIYPTDRYLTDTSPSGHQPERTITREKTFFMFRVLIKMVSIATYIHRTKWRNRTVLMKAKRNKNMFCINFCRETTQTLLLSELIHKEQYCLSWQTKSSIVWVTRQRTILSELTGKEQYCLS